VEEGQKAIELDTSPVSEQNPGGSAGTLVYKVAT